MLSHRDRVLLSSAIGLFVVAGLIVGSYAFMPAPELPTPPKLHAPPAKSEPDMSDLIRVTTPKPNDVVSSPLTVEGEARGTWYFEASFPVELLDANGTSLFLGPAQAQDEWMTENFVPFKIVMTFKKPLTDTGTLVLKNDNPSGEPERDKYLRIPVRFGAAAPPVVTKTDCHPTGCSNQVCSDENVMTDCSYQPEYACYKNAKCERQDDGSCGWTQTTVLKACLKAAIQ